MNTPKRISTTVCPDPRQRRLDLLLDIVEAKARKVEAPRWSKLPNLPFTLTPFLPSKADAVYWGKTLGRRAGHDLSLIGPQTVVRMPRRQVGGREPLGQGECVLFKCTCTAISDRLRLNWEGEMRPCVQHPAIPAAVCYVVTNLPPLVGRPSADFFFDGIQLRDVF